MRKRPRPCDRCRSKRVRCDGPGMPDLVCTGCKTINFDCTYSKPPTKRWPSNGYVKSLENCVEVTEKLLKDLFPNVDLDAELGPSITSDNWMYAAIQQPTSSAPEKNTIVPTGPRKRRVRTAESTYATSSDGTSSWDSSADEGDNAHSQNLDAYANSCLLALQGTNSNLAPSQRWQRQLRPTRARPQFWTTPKCERPKLSQNLYLKFPPPDILQLLINVYFHTFSLTFPFLHRGLFEKQLQANLHLRDDRFGAVVLLLCAVASRNTNNPHTLAIPGNRHSAGWNYYKQVEDLVKREGPALPDLVDMHIFLLALYYLGGTSSLAPLSLALVNKGIRLCQAIDAHRNKTYNGPPNLINELWKRAFWALVTADRLTSTLCGRRCTILDEDFDLDFPLLIDDSCWDLTDPNHKYPLKSPMPNIDGPCDLELFILLLKLTQIMAHVLRTLYSIGSFKLVKSTELIMSMDSALNEWFAEIPSHLAWDPQKKNVKWFSQSAILHCCFYNAQIFLHRPMMFQQRAGLPSLAICSHAARSIGIIVETQLARSDSGRWYHGQAPISLVGGLVLLVDLWNRACEAGRPANHPIYKQQWEDINRCMRNLESIESDWYAAGKFLDVIRDLAQVSPPHQDASSTSAELHTDVDSGEVIGHDMLNMPIFATSPEATPPHEDLLGDRAPAGDVVTSMTQLQGELGGDWEILEELGLSLLKMPTDGQGWMEGPMGGSPELEMPFTIQPYGTLGLGSWS